jgi:hypothetical protein
MFKNIRNAWYVLIGKAELAAVPAPPPEPIYLPAHAMEEELYAVQPTVFSPSLMYFKSAEDAWKAYPNRSVWKVLALHVDGRFYRYDGLRAINVTELA